MKTTDNISERAFSIAKKEADRIAIETMSYFSWFDDVEKFYQQALKELLSEKGE